MLVEECCEHMGKNFKSTIDFVEETVLFLPRKGTEKWIKKKNSKQQGFYLDQRNSGPIVLPTGHSARPLALDRGGSHVTQMASRRTCLEAI